MPEPTQDPVPDITAGNHESYMRLALSLAAKSPPKPTNYRVGAVMVDSATNEVLATGYTLELPGNTHAEQCCIDKLAQRYAATGTHLGEALPDAVDLYTTMEPCSQRLSGNTPCVDRILAIGKRIKAVYVGVQEPDTFVSQNSSRKRLEGAGIEVLVVEGLEQDILEVATAGHDVRSLPT
ncbi:cytidine deaminase-like protein [Nemania sp. FL0916]|nr:cytidine deaminase-like protein [Nemania sp. FL0916]